MAENIKNEEKGKAELDSKTCLLDAGVLAVFGFAVSFEALVNKIIDGKTKIKNKLGDFFDQNKDIQYAYPDGTSGWEGDRVVTIEEAIKIGESFFNRNSLHVDVTGEVSKNKTLAQRLVDSLNLVRDDDSKIHGPGGKSAYGPDLSMIQQIFNDKGMGNFELYTLKDNEVFSDKTTAEELSSINFVRLNDKKKYISIVKKGLLEMIQNYFRLGYVEPNFLKSYYELKIITPKEIMSEIKSYLDKRSVFITRSLIDGTYYTKYPTGLASNDLDIFSWGISNNKTVKDLLFRISFDNGYTKDYYEDRMKGRDLMHEMFSTLGLSYRENDENFADKMISSIIGEEE